MTRYELGIVALVFFPFYVILAWIDAQESGWAAAIFITGFFYIITILTTAYWIGFLNNRIRKFKDVRCEHEGCNQTDKDHLTKCIVENFESEMMYEFIYCDEHTYEHGFCHMCGEFWGGIDSFDFNNPAKTCEDCLDHIQSEIITDEDMEEDIYG